MHVVIRPVADEHALGRIGHADGSHRGPERLRMRLDPRDLAAVDRPVDQVEDLIPDEDPLVGGARPHRVGQHADLDAAAPQFAQQRRRVRIGERVRIPRLVVAGQEGFRRGHSGPREDGVQGRALLRALGQPPQVHFGGPGRRRRGGRLGGRVVPRAHRQPQSLLVHRVPRGQRPAPVEDDRPDRHPSMLRRATDKAARRRLGPVAHNPACLLDDPDRRNVRRDSRTVDVHVSRLRRKLGPVHGQCLVTEHRAGYQFRPLAMPTQPVL